MHGEKMVMERLVLERLERHLTSPSKPDSPLQTLASARALILHPDTSSSTHRAVLDTLARILSHEQATTPLIGHAIKLLGEVAVVDRSLPQSVIGTVRSLLSSGKRVASEALAFFISIAESGGGGGASSLVKSVFDLDLVFSLASSHVVAVRSLVPRLLLLDLSAGDVFSPFQPRLSVLLGLTADLYPSVRRAALDGLVALYKDAGAEANASEVEACYNRAVVLLHDDNELVRLSAVLLIGECGQLLSATKEAVYDGERSDRVFLQLCSMARDMNMKIRVDAFATLGKAKMVSETILLQSLSKKVLKSKSGGNSLFACTVKESKLPLSCAAGVFVHGLEDEYYQVRKAACKSLGMLTMMSLQFANEALNLLMDMLNDDAMAVQLQTLQALFHMATHDRLMLQEKHMHMFLGTLADVSTSIRCASREVLQVLKVPNMGIFESSVNVILTNLEKFPEDEKDVLLVLFFVGKNHGKFAAHFVSTLLQELELNEGDLKLDRPRVAALLMLAISSTFSSEKLTYDIPERIFSYAVPLLGRFSCSLVGVMNQDTLLAHLFQHSRMCFSDTKSNVTEGELLSHAAEVGIFSYTMNPDGPDQICSSAWPGHDANLEMSQVSAPLVQFQLKKAFADEEVTHTIKPVLRTAADTWPLIQSSCTDEVLRTLRTCKEELELVDQKLNGCFDAWLSFASQYVQVIQLIAQVWEQMRPRGIHIVGMNKLEFLLEKLDVSLRKMRYGFSGLSKEEECHILELILLCYVVRLSRIGFCCHTLSKRLQATISRLEYICEGLTHLSGFVKETRNLFCQRGEDEAFSPFDENSLLQLFSIERILFSGRFKLLKAELQVPCNDSENPLPFISGLPVGITFHITLYNISDHCRLWLSMTVDESIQHAFLDLSRFEGTHELRKCILIVPFYWTPKVVSFQLKACVVLECPSECVTQWKGHGGPKYETTYLCEGMDVYLVRIENV